VERRMEEGGGVKTMPRTVSRVGCGEGHSGKRRHVGGAWRWKDVYTGGTGGGEVERPDEGSRDRSA